MSLVTVYSTWKFVHGEGMQDGRERGRREGACGQLGKLLLRHGKRLRESPTPEQQELLDRLVATLDLEQLEQVRDRLLSAGDWAGLLRDIEPSGEVPPQPAYLVPCEFDPGPLAPSIDEYAVMERRFLGGKLILHIRIQRLYQDDIGAVLYQDSKRLEAEQHCPNQTAVMLLCESADGPAMTGEYAIPGGGTYHYVLTRVWERDAEEMLQGAGLAIYAPLARFASGGLPDLLRRVEQVIERDARNEQDRENAWVVLYGSMGLRYPAEQVNALLAHKLPYLRQTAVWRDIASAGYQAGCSQGYPEGAVQVSRRWILHLGGQRLGPPPTEIATALEAVTNLERLEQLAARVLKEADWQTTLAPN
jgi:hypothetical protein